MRWNLTVFLTGVATLLGTGCVPDEDTQPSSALFPVSHYGEVRPDFSTQLASRVVREDAELFALLGTNFSNRQKKELDLIKQGLSNGVYVSPNDGKRIYRINSMDQARKLLGESWSEETWKEKSDLAKFFDQAPNASVAFMGQNDQRILFFDQTNHLVGVFPKAS